MDKISKVVPLDDFLLDIVTSSGVSGVVDVKPYMREAAFRELENPAYFKQVRPAHHGIRWPNGQDLSSDTLIWDITKREHLHAAEAHAPYGATASTNLDQPV